MANFQIMLYFIFCWQMADWIKTIEIPSRFIVYLGIWVLNITLIRLELL